MFGYHSSKLVQLRKTHHTCVRAASIPIDIEDSINTEKYRGYHYKHLFSHNWNAMKGFHLLMRLGHAMNALSQFAKKLKQYVKANGSSATLKFIKDTLFNPWLSDDWIEDQFKQIPQLRFLME